MLCTRIQNALTADMETRASADEVLYSRQHLHLLLALNVLAERPFRTSVELLTRAAGMRSPHALEILCDDAIRVPSATRNGYCLSELKFDSFDDITHEDFKGSHYPGSSQIE